MNVEHRSRQAGFTLVEITIILLVLSILGAILLPATERYIDLARVVRAKEDVGAIGAVILLALHDLGENFFLADGSGTPTDHSPTNRIQMLVSDGDIPGLDPNPPADGTWQTPIFPGFSLVDTLAHHLVEGNPFGGSTADAYNRPTTSAGPGWRGAYINTPVLADPWGMRYAVNVEYLDRKHAPPTGDVVVYCTGPDQTIQSAYTASGFVAQGDDIACVLSGSHF